MHGHAPATRPRRTGYGLHVNMADSAMYRPFGVIAALLATTIAGTLLLKLNPQRKIILMRIQIFLLFFMVMCALSRFVWINLTVLLPSRRSNSKIVLVVHWVLYAVLAIFLGLAFFSFLIGRFFVGFEPYFISRVAFTCLGLFLLVFFNLCVLSVVFAVMRVCSFSLPNADKLKAIMAITVSLLLCIQGLTAASRGPTIVGVTVPLARLPRSLDGTRIVQLSDIHLGPMIGQAALDRVVNMVSVIKPDIIVITGDLVDSTVANLKQAILPLKNLKSKYGSFFVTGIKFYRHVLGVDGRRREWEIGNQDSVGRKA